MSYSRQFPLPSSTHCRKDLIQKHEDDTRYIPFSLFFLLPYVYYKKMLLGKNVESMSFLHRSRFVRRNYILICSKSKVTF